MRRLTALRRCSPPFVACLVGCATVPSPPELTLDAFEATLAAQASATAALGEWCARQHIATPAAITARPAGGEVAAVDENLRESLEVGPDEAVGYRHVLLSCGGVVLSDAQNWYVPARLTPEMNALLDTTDTPFGRAVAALDFTRERLAAQRGAAAQCPADTILSHAAVLRLPDGRPISMVVECYTPANLSKGARP